jgi:hypothetical protein
VPNAQIALSLGRNLAAGATATATVALISPMTTARPQQRYDHRLRQLVGARGRPSWCGSPLHTWVPHSSRVPAANLISLTRPRPDVCHR